MKLPFNRESPEEKEIEIMEDMQEANDQTIIQDGMQNKGYAYASHMMPEDYFQYRRFSNIPEAQAEFEGLVDKDVVFANLTDTQREELRFIAGTIKVCEDSFVKEQEFRGRDDKGREIIIPDQLMFDEDFRPIINFLKTEYKFDIVSSRAKGDTRATMLDVTSYNNINKNITKKKGDNNNRWGMGQ